MLILTITLGLHAQTWTEVKESGEYLWGEGQGETVREADQQALADLVSRIAVHVLSDFDQVDEEKTMGGRTDAKSYVSNRLNTFSQATLTNTERFVLKNEPDAIVGRAIRRTEINRIFQSRINKAVDMVATAQRAEADGRIDDALRNLYWAHALVRSLQHPNEVRYTDESGREHVLMVWIPEYMNQIFDQLKAVVVERKGDDVRLALSYKGKPVTSLDYTYFDGRDWSAINSAKDGVGILELAPGNQSANYQLKYEYEYQSEAHIDKEVEAVLEVVRSHALRKSYAHVDAKPVAGAKVFESQKSFSQTDASIKSEPRRVERPETYARTLNAVMKAVPTKDVKGVEQYFTANGLDIFRSLIYKYGNARVLDASSPTFYPMADGSVVARGVRMSFAFKTGVRRTFVEDIVFTFDAEGRIDNVAFGLGKLAEDDILMKGVWSETARKVLMNFLENYKTAYALKRTDFIRTIFDDDAVIIVANVAKRMNQPLGDQGTIFQNDKIIRYNRYTKDQYLRNLERCFRSNEYINIRFEDNDVMKLNKGGETYAIQISQDYYSSSYGDKGYLFLIVDVNDPKHPLIKVRTWQPEKDPEFGLYGPGDFK